MKKVVVGMSGGIDSFVTALLLQKRGYEVAGVTLELWGSVEMTEVKKRCAGLGIPLYVRDGRELFRQVVVDSFIAGYRSGCTPSPCCICNSCVKWELLRSVADELGIEYMATGHYVRIERIGRKYYVRRGVDAVKDQSYFLWGVSQEILSRALTPLGEYTKAEVKAWAVAHGYSEIAARKESMGVCFLRGKDYRDFITREVGQEKENCTGDIVDREGNCLGRHEGLWNYTIGQKRNMPAMAEGALYVADIDPVRNVIVADVKSALYAMTLEVGQINVVEEAFWKAADITVKIRGIGLNPGGYVRIVPLADGGLKVFLSEPAWAVAPGQPVAFYRDDLLLGGGISRRLPRLEDERMSF